MNIGNDNFNQGERQFLNFRLDRFNSLEEMILFIESRFQKLDSMILRRMLNRRFNNSCAL